VEMLDQLASRVEAAAEEIARLREANAELERRIVELEASSDAARWETERAELRRRAEQLVSRLESLLAS